MRQTLISYFLCLSLIGLCAFQGKSQSKTSSLHLDSFFIVSTAVSDASPFWYKYVLDVRSTADGTLVRNIRIAPLDFLCGNVTVKAAEKQLRGITPLRLVGSNNPCALTVDTARQSIKKPRVMESIFESIRFGIVASCGGEERVFQLPFKEEVDFRSLAKEAPRVAALWDLSRRVQIAAFGNKSIFYDISEERDSELQKFGDSLVSDLLTGKYDAGFSEFCGGILTPDCNPSPTKTLLHGFRPGLRVPDRTPKLENVEQYHFVRYVAPVYPRTAQAARVESRITLEVVSDKDTGKTLKAIVLEGHPLLNQSAITAALQWQFDPSMQKTDQPIRLVLIYSLACP